ncbi:MAG: hypothetical protein KBT27_11680 [Prevotellaceae bacterium]|nr:hypothetical protein [Candidatus Faecinaster equi]
MKELNRINQVVYYIGAILIFIGAASWMMIPDIASYIFSLGAIMFAIEQIRCNYEGKNFVIRRLRHQQIIGAIMLLITGALMFADIYEIKYLRHNTWMVSLMIAALLELYTSFRIPHEIDNEEKNNKQ